MRKDRIFCGLDIGSSQIKASILRFERDEPAEVLAAVQLKTQGAQGSSVTDLRELSDSIHRILFGLMRKADVKFKSISLGIGGHLIEKRCSLALIPLLSKGSKAVTSFDIRKVDEQARLLGVNLDERLMHQIPARYVVDGFNVAINPLGLLGHKLEVDMILVLAKNNLINNLTNAVHQAGFDVASTRFSSLCAADTCLSVKEKKEGCLFLSIGASSSDLIFFKDGFLKDIIILPYGGDHLTSKISEQLQLPFDLTEEIKCSYAQVTDSFDVFRKQEILVKREKGYMPLDRADVCNALMPVVHNFSQDLKNAICQAGMETRLNAGIIVSGGGALLTGLMEYIEGVTKLPTSIGKISIEATRLGHPVLYAACVGLAQQETCPYPKVFSSARHQEPMGKQFVNRLKELYQEYF